MGRRQDTSWRILMMRRRGGEKMWEELVMGEARQIRGWGERGMKISKGKGKLVVLGKEEEIIRGKESER